MPDLYVDPAFRRRGAARELLDACLEAARERGCHGLVLASGHQRAEAHQLYEDYGFTHTGRVYGLMLHLTRLPLPYGSRLAVVDAGEDAVVLAPPPPVEPIADIAAAVRDALRFPLAGQPLEALVTRGGRATVVVEPPALPIPGSPNDPRRTAIAATMIELDRAGRLAQRPDAARRGRARPEGRATASWSSSFTRSSRDGSTAASRCTTPRARTSSR